MIGVPNPTSTPAPGVCSITTPSGNVTSGRSSTIPTSRPAFSRIPVAASRVWPTTDGAGNPWDPLDITISMVEPVATEVPVGGSVLMTIPGSIVSWPSKAVMTSNPSSWRNCAAASEVRPATFGTVDSPGSSALFPARLNRTNSSIPRPTRRPNAVMMKGSWDGGSSSSWRYISSGGTVAGGIEFITCVADSLPTAAEATGSRSGPRRTERRSCLISSAV